MCKSLNAQGPVLGKGFDEKLYLHIINEPEAIAYVRTYVRYGSSNFETWVQRTYDGRAQFTYIYGNRVETAWKLLSLRMDVRS